METEGSSTRKRWLWINDIIIIYEYDGGSRFGDILYRILSPQLTIERFVDPGNPNNAYISGSLKGYYEPQGWASDNIFISLELMSCADEVVTTLFISWIVECPATDPRYVYNGGYVSVGFDLTDSSGFDRIVSARVVHGGPGNISPQLGEWKKC